MTKMRYLLIDYLLRNACLVCILLVPLTAQADENTVQVNAASNSGAGAAQVLQEYLHAIYSRDTRSAYAFLSNADKSTKSYDEYQQETAGFSSHALSLARALAAGIKIENTRVEIKNHRAEIKFDAKLPNASDSDLRTRLHQFDNQKLAALADDELKRLIDEIRAQASDSQLPVLESFDESWNLVFEDGTWRIFENWAGAVRITFAAQTFENLGWEFVPMRDEIMAQHGETLHMKYLAKNLGSTETTGKARHIIGPGNSSSYLEVVSCFCFLEQTLAPGESVELPLVLRVNYDAPEDIKHISLEYEFYPIAMFPNADHS